MTQAEPKLNSEGADEEKLVSRTVSGSAQVGACSPEMSACISLEEATDANANAKPSAALCVKVKEETSSAITGEMEGFEVMATYEHNREDAPKMEGRRVEGMSEHEKGSTPNVNEQRGLKKVAAIDSSLKPSSSALVKVEEGLTIGIMDVEDKAEEEGSGNQALKVEVVDERSKEGTSNDPATRMPKRGKVTSGKNLSRRIRKKKTLVASINHNEDDASVQHKVGPSKEKLDEEAMLNEEDNGNQEMTTGLTITTSTTAAVAAGRTDNENKKEQETETHGDEVEKTHRDKVNKSLNKSRTRKKKSKKKTQITVADATQAVETGADKKLSTEKHAGMIFMCSAETKVDCYRYKIFGMPAGKKKMVAKAYKGMKLFLYDIDLKLLYGIYIATSKGGYNIQPKAFNSAFPSQVRFKVFKDYLPLPEEKFKAAIKTNYYKRKKFRLELSTEQVNKLSKLFKEATKRSKRPSGEAAGRRVRRDHTSRGTARELPKGTVHVPRSFSMRGRDDYATSHAHPGPHGSESFSPAYYESFSPAYYATHPPPAYSYEKPLPAAVDYYRRELPAEAYVGYEGAMNPDVRLPVDHAVARSSSYRREASPYYHGLHRESAQYHHLESRHPLVSPFSPLEYRDLAPPPYRYY